MVSALESQNEARKLRPWLPPCRFGSQSGPQPRRAGELRLDLEEIQSDPPNGLFLILLRS
jgi:hypothetical protein